MASPSIPAPIDGWDNPAEWGDAAAGNGIAGNMPDCEHCGSCRGVQDRSMPPWAPEPIYLCDDCADATCEQQAEGAAP